LKYFQQTMPEKFQSILDEKFFIAITIAIKKLIRINRTFIRKFPTDPD